MSIDTLFPQIVSTETILFWKWQRWKFSYSFRIMLIFYFRNWIVAAETIKGGKLFKDGNCSRKYGIRLYWDLALLWCSVHPRCYQNKLWCLLSLVTSQPACLTKFSHKNKPLCRSTMLLLLALSLQSPSPLWHTRPKEQFWSFKALQLHNRAKPR